MASSLSFSYTYNLLERATSVEITSVLKSMYSKAYYRNNFLGISHILVRIIYIYVCIQSIHINILNGTTAGKKWQNITFLSLIL